VSYPEHQAAATAAETERYRDHYEALLAKATADVQAKAAAENKVAWGKEESRWKERLRRDTKKSSPSMLN
jgi:hypothetical protein